MPEDRTPYRGEGETPVKLVALPRDVDAAIEVFACDRSPDTREALRWAIARAMERKVALARIQWLSEDAGGYHG